MKKRFIALALVALFAGLFVFAAFAAPQPIAHSTGFQIGPGASIFIENNNNTAVVITSVAEFEAYLLEHHFCVCTISCPGPQAHVPIFPRYDNVWFTTNALPGYPKPTRLARNPPRCFSVYPALGFLRLDLDVSPDAVKISLDFPHDMGYTRHAV